MSKNELLPCPLCGGEVKIIDGTNNCYGFQDYKIQCDCGLRFYSQSTCEHYFVGNEYHTPQTERAKKIAYGKMIQDWNKRAIFGEIDNIANVPTARSEE